MNEDSFATLPKSIKKNVGRHTKNHASSVSEKTVKKDPVESRVKQQTTKMKEKKGKKTAKKEENNGWELHGEAYLSYAYNSVCNYLFLVTKGSRFKPFGILFF